MRVPCPAGRDHGGGRISCTLNEPGASGLLCLGCPVPLPLRKETHQRLPWASMGMLKDLTGQRWNLLAETHSVVSSGLCGKGVQSAESMPSCWGLRGRPPRGTAELGGVLLRTGAGGAAWRGNSENSSAEVWEPGAYRQGARYSGKEAIR